MCVSVYVHVAAVLPHSQKNSPLVKYRLLLPLCRAVKVRCVGGTEPGKFGEPDAGAGSVNHRLGLVARCCGRHRHGLCEHGYDYKKISAHCG